jgi:S1-C subfamily serine protease
VPVSTGTGFFISHDGSLITNAHVVENCGTLRVRTSDGTFRSATIVSRDATNDLALLRTGRAQDQIASLRTDARLGEAAATFGFPHADVLASTGNFTAGNVTALVGLERIMNLARTLF